MRVLRGISPVLLVSWLIVAVFVASRGPLLSRAIRHGWHVDTNAQYHPMVMARAFVQEGGRTPYFLFPRWSARPHEDERWLLYLSWPPLPYYALTAIIGASRDPYVQILVARFVATLGVAVASWMVFLLFRTLTANDGLALIAQVVGTFKLDLYYFSDLPFGSLYSYPLALAQVLLLVAVTRGAASRWQTWSAYLVSAVAALTWWLNGLVPLAAVALAYALKVSQPVRRILWGIAALSTAVTVAAFSWLALAEVTTNGVDLGTGALGEGARVLSDLPGQWWWTISQFGLVALVQTSLEDLLRFVVPPFPFLAPNISVRQQIHVLGLGLRHGYSPDQFVTFPLVVLLAGLFAVWAFRGTRGWLAHRAGLDELRLAKFGLVLFAISGLLFIALLPSWAYRHPSIGRSIAIMPVGIVLAVGAYHEVRRRIGRRARVILATWLTLWVACGTSLTYSMVRTFDDSYNQAELAVLDWFREHAARGSVLINNIPAFDSLYAVFDLFYADARAYPFWSWARSLASPIGFVGFPKPDEALPYLDRVLAALGPLERELPGETVERATARVRALREAVVQSQPEALVMGCCRPEADRAREELANLYGAAFAELRSMNRALRARGLPTIALPLPVSWSRNENYLLLREDFGLPPLFQGIDYSVEFSSEFRATPDTFLGARTAYRVRCRTDDGAQWVPASCGRAAWRIVTAFLRGDWQRVRSLVSIEAGPSLDNFEYPLRGGGRVGKILLVKLRGE